LALMHDNSTILDNHWTAGIKHICIPPLASQSLPGSDNKHTPKSSPKLRLLHSSNMATNNGQQQNMNQQDPRFQTFVAAFVPLQKLLNNNAISINSYKAICALLEQELDNRPLQSEQDVISTIQSRAQAQVPPSPPPGVMQEQSNSSSQTKSRGVSDDAGSGTVSRGYVRFGPSLRLAP